MKSNLFVVRCVPSPIRRMSVWAPGSNKLVNVLSLPSVTPFSIHAYVRLSSSGSEALAEKSSRAEVTVIPFHGPETLIISGAWLVDVGESATVILNT